MKWGFRFKAIAWGVGVDFATSLLSGLLMGIGFLIFFASKHPHIYHYELSHWLRISVPLKVAGSASGFFCSFLGGIVAAYLAPAYEFRNAAATGLVGMLVSLGFVALCHSDPFYTGALARSLAYLSTPVAAILGGMALTYWTRQGEED